MSKRLRSLPLRRLAPACLVVVLLAAPLYAANAKAVARCGKGWLEHVDGYPVLHLKGSPYEMGYQHGALLKESVRQNMHNLLTVKGDTTLVEFAGMKLKPRHLIDIIIRIQDKYVPKKYFDELDGLAAGAGMKAADIRTANFIPELFHCSGFALMNSATKNGMLYHGRVLDYAVDWGLQEHAVVIVAEPDGGIPYVNISYAGFIGCVTGMNAKSVSIGEMGGRGQGHWAGVPMAFLVREALEKGDTLDSALAVFRDNPRTCQYYYVVADGKTNRAVGMEASWNVFRVIKPGEKHPLLPSPVKNCALLSAGSRYQELVRRVKAGYGKFTPETALHLMDRPVAMKSNLHNVLFEPKTTRFWVANASKDKKPAATQKYYRFRLTELLKRQPPTTAKQIPLPPRTEVTLKR
jgi:isopenicillin-N N-acyltransferase like protein